MSNVPFLSSLSRPVALALAGTVALVVVTGLLFAAMTSGSEDSGTEATAAAAETATVSAATEVPTDAAAATPDAPATDAATPAGTPPAGTPAAAITPASPSVVAATPSVLYGGGWGSGPDGDAGGMRTYPGPGPQGGSADIAWKLDIPAGYAVGEPVVYGNRLLVTATSEAFGSNLTVYDLGTGTFVWSYAQSGTISSPFVAEGRVFVTSGSEVVALSLDAGDVLWTQQVDAGSRQQVGGDDNAGGRVSTPVADGNAVIVTAGASVVALDAATGSERWQHEFAGATALQPQLIGDFVTVVTVSGATDPGQQLLGRYHGLSLSSGAEVWRQDAVEPGDSAASADAGVVMVNDQRDGVLAPRLIDARTGRFLTVEATCGAWLPQAVGASVACDGIDAISGDPVPGANTWPSDAEVRATTGETVFLVSGTEIIAVDLASGETTWALDLATEDLEHGHVLKALGVVSVGDHGLAVEVLLADASFGDDERAIWIINDANGPAATPVAGTPQATPAAGATPEA